MKGLRESIEAPQGQSFRAIRWRRNLREVESIQPDGSLRRIAGEGVHWHHHAEMELTYFLEGSGTRFVGDHIGEFGKGDLVLLGSDLPHYWHAAGQSAGVSIQWHFPRTHVIWEFAELAKVQQVFSGAERGYRLKGRTAAKISSVLEEMMSQDAGHRLAKLMEIFALLSVMPARDREVLSSKGFGPAAAMRHQGAIAKAVRHVLANFRGEIRVEDLLAVTGMSRATFARQFKQHAGRTLSGFVNKVRLQAACRALAETDAAVTEIAMNCGFGEISFFNRVFRREKGCSPREWRKGRKM
jgi:AraC-like DNA-binding protein/mannose-6-phosphate isomerase-like protein (cupin superfamily)